MKHIKNIFTVPYDSSDELYKLRPKTNIRCGFIRLAQRLEGIEK